ncbi:hypothetical protein Hbl1158_02985 [Halobaculum sp. CBA1158]|uniref:hypothetical protein n=1 Tax=Halobaculum sp. CBA1158 TaxID=2904243 RepID=UPI001F2553FD|nr:hypothetical protein [Halobaculum sp. CBA1158]UIP00351.1 hypothetical protein Hbl1158_02985 [Halobaculum sp. CBA1158]
MSSDLSDWGGGAPVDEPDEPDDQPRDRSDSRDTDQCEDCGEYHVGVHVREAVAPDVELCPGCALKRLEGER